jgi:acyl-CoA thioester hydrolase
MSRHQHPSYFDAIPEAPQPLSVVVHRQVRYEEVDALGVVWHGRYVSFLEDGRAMFGERYNLNYLTMYESKVLAPIVKLHIDYHLPLRLSEKFSIFTELVWSESARINFQYRIVSENGLHASAYTVQLLTNEKFEVQFIRPQLIEDFCKKWKEELLK